MTIFLKGLAVAALASSALACQADSAVSSASSAGSASVGSSSDSIKGSSNSSSRNDDRVSEGDYRVLAVQALADRPGMLRLTLQRDTAPAANGVAGLDAPAEGFFLDLPAQALQRTAVAQGDTVSARHRPYGVEFARADTREPFFLVVADQWFRGLESHAVAL